LGNILHRTGIVTSLLISNAISSVRSRCQSASWEHLRLRERRYQVSTCDRQDIRYLVRVLLLSFTCLSDRYFFGDAVSGEARDSPHIGRRPSSPHPRRTRMQMQLQIPTAVTNRDYLPRVRKRVRRSKFVIVLISWPGDGPCW
jgi:hypothetical protein